VPERAERMIWSSLVAKVASGVALALLILLGVQTVRLNFADTRADKAESARELAEADLSACKANRLTLESSIAAQNAALAEKSQQDAQRLADASKAVTAASKDRAGAEARANRLLTSPTAGNDACARAMAAREAVLKELK
jgi:uncharacterized protein YlxW (UPF0749 family)